MSEKYHSVNLDLETATRVNNEKRLKESWSECIARVFEKYADYKKEGFVQ